MSSGPPRPTPTDTLVPYTTLFRSRRPERDSYSDHRDKMHANMAVAMGGGVAEEIIFGYDKVSSGASGDIQYATKLARDMVTQWGMSDKLGQIGRAHV